MTSFMPGADPGIVIQKRDRHLLEELALLRVIDREQAKIVGNFSSTTRVNTRLLALTRASLLRRFFLGASEGSKKAVYALSAKGAALIGATPRGPRRTNDALLVADFFILHQLAINDIYCALKLSTASSGISLARWLSFHEPLTHNLRLIPDAYFELNTPTAPIATFLEVDLGHERLMVWTGKIRNYLQFALSGDYERNFGQKQFRVLVVVNSERRLQSIRKAVRASTEKIFWFTTIDSFRSHGPFAAIWLRPEDSELQPFFPTPFSIS
jgi:Replication-relaxation